MSFYEGFEKRSVDLKGLRKAWGATVKPYLLRSKQGGHSASYRLNFSESHPNTLKNLRENYTNQAVRDYIERLNRTKGLGRIFVKGPQHKRISANEGVRLKQLRHTLSNTPPKEQPVTYGLVEGAVRRIGSKFKGAKGTESRLDPKNKEAINRIVGIHEGIERKVSKNLKRLGGWTRGGHISPEVLLRESNIVSTLPKELKGAKSYLKTIRMSGNEKDEMRRMFPGFEYGKGRISRHARKPMMERAAEKVRIGKPEFK